jgi:tetratricopeptide (TPR) repeat protein
MQREPPRRAGGGPIASPPSLEFRPESKLEREDEVLDALVSALARGQLTADVWTKLHEAAVRDERVSELAFAYESYAQGRRLKMFPPPIVAELLFKAAMFFAEVLGDDLGARNYLERALTTLPTHQAAFERLDQLLTKGGDTKRLAEICVSTAQHRPRTEQIDLLRRAAGLVEKAAGGEERSIEIHQQLLRLDPADARSRRMLEEKYLRTNRHRDVARLLEQAFAADPAPPDSEALAMRSRLIELYATQLHEPERTMPHVEALLALDPGNDEARRAATKLIAIKGLAARAAAALADATEKVGVPDDVARYLAIELEHTRGPKRREVLTRLGILRQDRLNDSAGAYEAFEQALLLDPSEDEQRVRFVTLSLKLGKPLDAARTLSRVATVAKDPRVRARISAETGELLAAGGDTRRARTTFLSVLSTPASDAVAILKAARALAEIYAAEKESKALAAVLEKIAETETEPEKRAKAIQQLGELASNVLKDAPKAIAAWKQLVDGPMRAQALSELEPLYESSGANVELASVLEERAKDAVGPEARRLAVRSAEVLTRAGDAERASLAWKRVVDKHGASRDVLGQWLPLLESTRQWPELAHALEADAQLAPEAERAAVWARLGHVHLQRTRQTPEAIDAFRRALAVDPSEKTSRASLEKLLGAGDHRLAAAHVLEPVYRAEDGSGAPLLRVLDAKASLDPEGTARLAALAEALTIATRLPQERGRAVELAARGLGEAVSQGTPLATWLARLDALAGSGVDAKRLASLLGKALGDRPVTSNELSALAKRVGEAHAASGDVAAAIAAYRRALDFEPSSGELLGRVDELLRDQGNPLERVELYRAALARGVEGKRRRELLHAIGVLTRDDLRDTAAAIESYKAALVDDSDDTDAHAALVDLYTATEAWEALAELLEQRILRATGSEAIVVRAQLAELAATHGQKPRARAHAVALLAHPDLPAPALDVVERVAEELDDVPLARAVLERRASEAHDAREQVGWLTRLGILEHERAHEIDAAIVAWKRAAALAQTAGDDAIARDLYERVLEIAPRDAHAAQCLAELLEHAEAWNRLPPLYAVLVETAATPTDAIATLARMARVQADKLGDVEAAATAAERAFLLEPTDRQLLAAFERYAIAARATTRLATVLQETIAGGAVAGDAWLRADLALTRARALASAPETQQAAIETYRALLTGDSLDESRARGAVESLQSLLETAGTDARSSDWRWLHSWRVGHAPEGERTSAILAWAAVEETRLGDAAQALALYREVLAIDPDNVEAMGSIARIALASGDVDAGLAALVTRRDRCEGAARNAADLEIATVLLDRGVRLADALRSVAAVLESTPNDAPALALSARLLGSEESRAPAIAMLERTLESVDDAEVRAQILVRLLETPTDAASRGLRRGWFERLLDLRQARGELEEALATIVRAASELPTVESLWERAEALARAARRPDEIAALYARVLASPLGREEALALGQRAVAFHEEWFEDSERVVRILERMVEIDPSDEWGFDRLKLIFDAAERWDDLFALYDRAVAAASGARRIELLEDAAQVAKDFANRSERAIGYLEQLIALRPDARLAASLERLYERHGRHRELVWLLYARIPQLGSREAQAVRARIIGILLGELGDAASALAVVEELIAMGGDAAIDVPGLLERILAVAPATAEVRESIVPPPEGSSERPSRAPLSSAPSAKRTFVRQRAAALLKERYAEAGRDADLVRVLEIELESIKSIRERIRRHRQIAELYTTLGRDTQALEHAVSLVLLEPDVVGHRTRLAELAARVGRQDRLAEVLVAAAEDCTDDSLRVDLLMQAGTVNSDSLQDDARAIDLFFRVLDVPGHDAAHLAAARRLAPLLERVERPYERLDVMERIAALEPDTNARRVELGQIAALASSLGESDRAIHAWELRLRDEPTDPEALGGLVVLLEKEHRWRPLIEVLDRRAESTSSDEERRSDRVRAAEILRRELGAVDEAIVAWRAIEAELGPTDESTRALAALLRAAERWSELAAILSRAAAEANGAVRADLLAELGDIHRQLGVPRDAVEAYEAALAVAPRHDAARAGLHAIAPGVPEYGSAISALLMTYRETDEWRAILGLLEPRLAVAPNDAARVEVLREAAGLSASRAEDREGAFSFLRRALLLDPSREDVATDLRRTAEEIHAWRPLADVYREALDLSESLSPPPPWVTRLRLAFGATLEAKLDDPRGALASYMRVLEVEPAQSTATHAAIRAAARTGRWDAVAKTLVDAACSAGTVQPELLATAEEALGGASAWDGLAAAFPLALAERGSVPSGVARDLEARLGEWHRDRRGDPESAEESFVRALTHAPDDAELLAALAQLQRRTKGRPLVDSLLRLSVATGGDLDLLREAADVARTSVSDRVLAKSIVERVLGLAIGQWVPAGDDAVTISSGSAAGPSSYVEWAIGEMSSIHEEEGEPAKLVDLLLETSRLPFPREQARVMRHEAARIAADRIGDLDRAIGVWTALFQDDPHDTTAVARLIAALEAQGKRAQLLEVRRAQVESARTLPMRVAVRLESARLESALGQNDGAIASLEANLDEDGRHQESVGALVALLEGLGRNADLASLLARQAEREESASEPRVAADLWTRAADVAETRLDDMSLAIANHRRVIALEPRAHSLDALARLLAAKEEWSEAALHLDALLAVCDASESARVALRLAGALTADGDEDAARAKLEEAFARDPAAEAVVARLAESYRERREWRKLADLLSRSANHARDKAARLAALREAANLHRHECDTPAEAIPLLEQASDLDPDDRGLRLSLADALGAAQRYGEARAVLRALIDGFGGRRPKERAPVHYQLAQLDLALGDRAQALVELDAATRIDPANPEILRALAELARDDGQLERAERSYRALLAVLRRADDPPEDAPIVRTEVLVQLAALARGEKEMERATELVESALEVASKSEVEARRLENALRSQGDFGMLARALEARIARGGDADVVAVAMADRADLLDAHLERSADALHAVFQALALAPHLPALHETAARLARRSGALPAYAEKLGELGAAAEARQDDDAACDLALRVGALFEHDLGDDAEAARHYERAQRFQLRLPDVLRALDRIYERLGDSSAQARVLAKRIDVESMSSGAAATTDAIYRLSRLKLLKPDSLDEGCDLLVTALQIAPDYERAKAVLQAATSNHARSERLVEIYERIGKAPGQERALVEALTLRADLPGAGLDPLREASEIALKLEDVSLTESLLRRLIGRASEDSSASSHLTWAMTTLARLREAAGDVADAVALKRQAADLAEGDEARRLHFEVARLAKDALHDLALATSVYEQLHEREPVDRDAWEPLLEVYRLTGAHAARAALIARVAEFVDDPAERSRLRLERARVTMTELGAGDAAAPMLREIVDDDASQVEAAILLAGILERGGQDDELAALLARQIDAAKDRSDAASVAELSLRLGALVERRSALDARAVYYSALEWDGANRECLRALVRLHAADDDVSDRADVMERLLPLEEGERVEAVAVELADLRRQLGDTASVRRALEAGFRVAPASTALRERLEATYAAGEEWGRVAELYEADAQSRTDRGERIARLRDAASVWRTKAKDPAQAAAVLRRARAEAQEDVNLLGELVQLLSASGDKAGATLELTLAIDWLGDDRPATASLLEQRAELRAELGDEDGALFDLEHAFRVGGSDYAPAVVLLLERLVAAAWEASDAPRWRVMRLRLAEMLALTGDADQARLLLADLLKHDAKDRDALRALARLEERAEKWDAASATYRRLVALEEPENVVDTALHLADACERAGRLGDARGGLERARMVSPANEALTSRLLAVYEATGAYRELALLHTEEAKEARDVAGRFAHLLRAGTLMLQHGADANAALVPLREANALRPGDLECSARLAEGLAAVGRTQEATELLSALLAPHKGRRSRELAVVHHAASHVARAAGDVRAELTSLTAALDMDPQSGAVASELALVAREAGQLELAQRALRAITMLKSPAPLSRGLAYQYLGEIAQKQGDVKRAVMLLKRAVDDDPNLASARLLLSQLKAD